MAIMLPKLRPLLYDPVGRVRVAMADLLERVAMLKTLQWWKVVPATELIGVLATDTSAVAPMIQRLLFSQLICPDPDLDIEVLPAILESVTVSGYRTGFCWFLPASCPNAFCIIQCPALGRALPVDLYSVGTWHSNCNPALCTLH
jgi:hypothetical protein